MIKAKFDFTYRTYPVPEGLTPVEMVAFARGVDAVLEVTEPTPAPVRTPAYRYFHDNDDPSNSRWFRRVRINESASTDEVFRGYGLRDGWQNGHTPLTLDDLDAYAWVEVQYEELPAKAQDHEQYL